MEFRPLKASEIDVRVGTVSDKGVTLLLYKDARVDMEILDETVGKERWQRKHYEVKGNMYCEVGIKCESEWVWKSDCGVESNTEKEKGEASDSFKRACVNWGIGRELYTAPRIFAYVGTTQKDRGYKISDDDKYIKFTINKIVSRNGSIEELEIIDNEKNLVFTFKDGIAKSEKRKNQKYDKSSTTPDDRDNDTREGDEPIIGPKPPPPKKERLAPPPSALNDPQYPNNNPPMPQSQRDILVNLMKKKGFRTQKHIDDAAALCLVYSFGKTSKADELTPEQFQGVLSEISKWK